MEMSKIKKVHLVGIGGIGMSAVAKLMIALNKEVSGSDVYPGPITDELKKMGANIFSGHYYEQVPDDVDLLIYSSAVPEDNVERSRAREINALEMSYFEFLGWYSRDKFTIAISGTHGKSTTTAMIGKIMADAGLDPTVIVGSRLQSFEQGNFRFGKGDYFVVEACEYRANFLQLNPNILVITNIEAEHLDFYKDLEDVALNFQRLVEKLPDDGLLVYNADDPASVNLIEPQSATVNFSLAGEATIQAVNIGRDGKIQTFDVLKDGDELIGGAQLKIPGQFNIANALAAISVCSELEINSDVIKKSLSEFENLWRRLEVLGKFKGATIISDYGHHPTEVAAAIAAVREFYPGRRLVWVYQPHHHNRTKQLFDDFVSAFKNVDILIMSDIYDVAGREKSGDQAINSEKLTEAIKSNAPEVEVLYSGNLKNTEEKAAEIIQEGDVVVFQGAGTIDEAARNLIKQ